MSQIPKYWAIALGALREKRVTIAAWFFGGALAMYFEAIAIAAELRDFPGGPKALAMFITPTLEAMRILRWPADRIDTLGGYLNYHNVTLIALFLAIYAGLQGARLVRHLEEAQTIEVLLASGISRTQLLWSRSLGFFIAQIGIGIGLGLGTGLALWILEEPNWCGAFVTLLAVAICTTPAFGIGLVLSQFVDRSRTAASITSMLLTLIYALGNVADKYEWLSWISYISPFYYANLSRPLIPGFSANYLSWLFMITASVALVAISAKLWASRDVESVSWPRGNQAKTRKHQRAGFVPRTLVGDMLWRQRYGILAWSGCSAFLLLLFVLLMPEVMDVWREFGFLAEFASAGFGNNPEQQYLALIFEMLPALLAGYIIMQSSTWTSDLVEGRVQLWLANSVSVSGLLAQRGIAAMIGGQLIIIPNLLLVAAASSGQIAVDWWAIGRVYVIATVMSAALISMSQLVNSLTFEKNGTIVMAMYMAASWLIVFMAPYLDWPEWTQRFSIFDAFGHPFIDWPTPANFLVIAGMMILGFPLALLVSRLRSRVA